jgi:purine-nucleoside phosphorylase
VSASAPDLLRNWGAETAIILGSGLSAVVEDITEAQRLPYSDFPNLPTSSVAGHVGQFVLSTINGKRVVYAQGRVHLYEGYSAAAVAAGVRLLAKAGVQRVAVTNAAGALNREHQPGSWMMITDQLNLTGTSPLVSAAQFVDMSDAYSRRWREGFAADAERLGITLHQGVYAGVLGPQYETPAEVRMLRTLGADAVGMSTVLEVIQARALGLEVAGFSCLTNWAAGIGVEELTHAAVLATGRRAAEDFARLLATI